VRRLVTLAATIGIAVVVVSAATRGWSVGATTKADISKNEPGTPPADFQFLHTGEGDLGQWTVVRDTTAIDGAAIEHVSTDQHENRFALAIFQAERSIQDLEGNDPDRGARCPFREY
jgi:hypothetical protein